MTHPGPTDDERALIDRITVELASDGARADDTLLLLTRAIRAGIAVGRGLSNSGLTPQKVRRMRQLRAARVPYAKIATDEHVPLDLVREICR